MRVIGIAGWSGAGKTTLLTKLIPRLVERGILRTVVWDRRTEGVEPVGELRGPPRW